MARIMEEEPVSLSTAPLDQRVDSGNDSVVVGCRRLQSGRHHTVRRWTEKENEVFGGNAPAVGIKQPLPHGEGVAYRAAKACAWYPVPVNSDDDRPICHTSP